jgi:hypothetical protein
LAQPPAEQNAADQAPIRRFDPQTATLVPVAASEVVAGKLYNRYSERYGRYVWSYAQEGGGFGYTLGPGSTEVPENFDLGPEPEQIEALINEAAKDWYKTARNLGRPVFVRLGSDGLWRALQFNSIRSHYVLESGRRWEWHGVRRAAVSHTFGSTWKYDGRRYHPAGHPASQIYPGYRVDYEIPACLY